VTDQELRDKLASEYSANLNFPYTDVAQLLIADDFKAGWDAARANHYCPLCSDQTLVSYGEIQQERDELRAEVERGE
jgi:hypothetical protein